MDMEGDGSVTQKELRIFLEHHTALGNWMEGRGNATADELQVERMIAEVDAMGDSNSMMEE